MTRVVTFVLMLSLGLSASSTADYHIKQVMRFRDADQAKMLAFLNIASTEVEYWLSNDSFVLAFSSGLFAAPRSTLVDFVEGTCSILAHRTRRYVTTTLPFTPEAVYTEAVLQLAGKRKKLRRSVVPNDLRRKLEGLACHGYTITTDSEDDWTKQSTLWATEALGLDSQSLERVFAILAIQGTSDPSSISWPTQIKGFPLLFEMEFVTGGVTMEPTLVEQQPIPGELLVVPDGYSRVDRLDLGDLIDESSLVGKQMLGVE